ncbi:MAG: tetratricopeptide repeat protein [Myxococcota bacterium]|nr:tetratricopeptide repeat protein [Myxococcota bacterium]
MISRCTMILLSSVAVGCGAASPRDDEQPQAELARMTVQKQAEVRHGLIETLLASKAYGSAIPLINQALRQNPKDARLYTYRATVLRERGRLEQSLLVYQTAIELKPTLASAYAGQGIVLNLLGRHADATTAHREANRLVKGSSRWLNNLGFSLFLERKYEAAARVYEQAIGIDARLGIAFVNLGFALAAMGKLEDAKRAFGEVLNQGQILNNLALAKEIVGDPKAARRLYEEAIMLDPQNVEAADNLDALTKETTVIKEQP